MASNRVQGRVQFYSMLCTWTESRAVICLKSACFGCYVISVITRLLVLLRIPMIIYKSHGADAATLCRPYSMPEIMMLMLSVLAELNLLLLAMMVVVEVLVTLLLYIILYQRQKD